MFSIFKGELLVTKIQAPTHCPSCATLLEWVNDIIYCTNKSCDSRSTKRVEHFGKTLKIKGLGPATIKKLEIVDIDQIYSLTQEEITEKLSSEKLAEKLYNEICNSKAAPLNVVLPGFSIPLIGKTATEKLAKVINNISEIDESSCRQAGLGPKATDSLLEWLRKEFYCWYDGYLPFDFKFTKSSAPSEKKGVVCISGKLKTWKTKADATAALESAGFVVKSSLTKDVTILVNESGIESSKTKQARASGITIITNIMDILEK